MLLGGALAILAAIAAGEFMASGLARRSFVFYALDNGSVVVEERVLRVSKGSPGRPSREVDIARYVEEALLGPASPQCVPLFPQETRLVSLLYRDGVVYAHLSENAAMPLSEGPSGSTVFANIETLYAGIKRNFPYVRDTRFFIAGNAAYAGKFR